ncbi:MAG: tetraacyldisaccharide 4'-kinase [Legionellales bacterium]|nr:tetraacyldisaccharide 4'-kinase [Legionellales bacterium]
MDKKLLNLLRCPETGAPLVMSKDNTELICHANKLAYPIVDGIPILLTHRARSINRPTEKPQDHS